MSVPNSTLMPVENPSCSPGYHSPPTRVSVEVINSYDLIKLYSVVT